MISLVTNLTKTDAHNILLEIVDSNSITYYKDLGFPSDVFEFIENHQNDKKNKEKTLIFTGNYF